MDNEAEAPCGARAAPIVFADETNVWRRLKGAEPMFVTTGPITLLEGIDAGAKVVGVLGVLWGIRAGYYELVRARAQRKDEIREAQRRANAAEAQLWLELRSRFAEHDRIHQMLRNCEWPADDKKRPWPELEAYAGLIEHCKPMIDQGLINQAVFKNIYGYRIRNLLNEPSVRKKFENSRDGWLLLWDLVKQLELGDTSQQGGA